MLYYSFREIKNALRKKYTLVYVIVFLVLCIIANIAMSCFRTIYGMNDGSFAYNLIIFAEGAFAIPYYSCIFLSDIVFGPEYPDPHIRDRITKKLHRWQLYLGKLLATILLAIVLFAVAFALLIGTTALFGIHDGTIDTWTILDFLDKATVAFPLWVAGISIAQLLLFLHRDKKRAFIAFYIIVLLIPRLIMLFAAEAINFAPCVVISNYLITPQFNALQFFFTMDRAKCWIIGMSYTAVSSVLGIIVYYLRKDFRNIEK